ncbi:hypothetical protein [Vibrio mediterranei]|nr:hypothetical protein [Vibrio mediterranei]
MGLGDYGGFVWALFGLCLGFVWALFGLGGVLAATEQGVGFLSQNNYW